MKVFVRSFAAVVKTGQVLEREQELPAAATAADLMRALGIGADEDMIVLVNQRPSAPEVRLADGDRVTLMPPVSAA